MCGIVRLDPVQLAFDKAGNLMVVSYAGKGTVYWFRPDARDLDVTMIEAQKAAARPGMTPVLPVNYWRNENDFVKSIPIAEGVSVCFAGWDDVHSGGRGLCDGGALLRYEDGGCVAGVQSGQGG